MVGVAVIGILVFTDRPADRLRLVGDLAPMLGVLLLALGVLLLALGSLLLEPGSLPLELGGQPGPAPSAESPVDSIMVEVRGATPPPGRHALGEHLDDGVKVPAIVDGDVFMSNASDIKTSPSTMAGTFP